MKKKLFILLVLSFFPIMASSQSGFQYQLAYPQGNKILSVSVPDNNIMLGVGPFGTIVKSTNNGTTWTVLHFVKGLNTTFKSVHFSNSSTGYICSSNGHILKTTNTGNNWLLQNSSVSVSLNAINFISENTGFVVGESGVILKTTDAGLNWVSKASGTMTSLNSVHFPSANVGYISGQNGIILKSNNIGESWDSISGHSTSLTSVYFTNTMTGYICGLSVLKKTTNGGYDWANLNYGATTTMRSVKFINANTGFFCGGYKKVIKTTDAGNTFSIFTLGTGYDNLNSINFNVNGYGWTGGDYGMLFKSTNFGENWTQMQTTHDEYISYLKFDNANNGMVVDRMGAVLKTTNGGNNYFQTSFGGSYILSGFYFNDTSIGYGVGASGRIMKTIDGGNSWTQLNTGITTSLHKIHFYSGLGLAVGYYGVILRTNNGGSNWTFQTSTTNNWLKGVYIYNLNSMFVCGENQILKSSDGGIIWQSKTVGMSLDMLCIHTPDGINVWAGGGGIFYSGNSGENWSSQYITEYPITAIQFINSDIGYAVGSFGYVIKTTNGGVNWNKLNVPCGNGLYAINFINENTGWIAGEKGTILKTSSGGSVFIARLNTEIPLGFNLEQNYPNPFNGSTRISYSIPKNTKVEMKIYDMLGREVRTLVNEYQTAGNYVVMFNSGNLSSGVYFYRINAEDFSLVKKLVIIK